MNIWAALQLQALGESFRTEIEADASPSDLASHHTWVEPSATDTTIKSWKTKRELEKVKGRNLDPFDEWR